MKKQAKRALCLWLSVLLLWAAALPAAAEDGAPVYPDIVATVPDKVTAGDTFRIRIDIDPSALDGGMIAMDMHIQCPTAYVTYVSAETTQPKGWTNDVNYVSGVLNIVAIAPSNLQGFHTPAVAKGDVSYTLTFTSTRYTGTCSFTGKDTVSVTEFVAQDAQHNHLKFPFPAFSLTVSRSTSHTVAFDANGGVGAPGAVTKQNGAALTLPADIPTREKHDFLGWAGSASAVSAEYQPSGTLNTDSVSLLYAVWKRVQLTPVSSAVTLASGVAEMKGEMTAQQLASSFESAERISVLDIHGSPLGASSKAGTGCTVQITASGTVADSALLLLKGDINGDGVRNAADIAVLTDRIIRSASTLNGLTDLQKRAADLNGNGKCDSHDIVLQRKAALGK